MEEEIKKNREETQGFRFGVLRVRWTKDEVTGNVVVFVKSGAEL